MTRKRHQRSTELPGHVRRRPVRRRWPKADFDPADWEPIESELDVAMSRHAWLRSGQRLTGLRGEAAARWVRTQVVRASTDHALALHPPGWVEAGWASSGSGENAAWVVCVNGEQQVAALVALHQEGERAQLAVVTVMTADTGGHS